MADKRRTVATPALLHTLEQAIRPEDTDTHAEYLSRREPRKKAVSHLAGLLAGERRIAELSKLPIVGVLPFIRQYEEPIFFSRTLNLIQGQTGAHKSRMGELISAVLIAQGIPQCDTLGFHRSNELPQDYTLVYVDTERNLASEFPAAVQRIKEWAGFARTDNVPHFRYISLQGIGRAERFEALTEFLQYARHTIENHIVVVIDVLSDCVNDFNDPKDSLLLSDMLNQAINTFDVTFIGIIHENPGTTKARGHLGTEISNKSSTVMQVGYIKQASGDATGVIELRYIKRRHGRRNLVAHARFDEVSKQLVKATPEAVKEARAQRQRVATADALHPALLNALTTGPLEQGKLVAHLCTELKVSDKLVRTRLKEMEGTTISSVAGQAVSLKAVKEGRTTKYQLVPIPQASNPE